MNIFTIGHSTHTKEKFHKLVNDANIKMVWGAPPVLCADGVVVYPK